MEDIVKMRHELKKAEAFSRGNLDAALGIFEIEKSNLRCKCNECKSEYARGWQQYIEGFIYRTNHDA